GGRAYVVIHVRRRRCVDYAELR
ncbi:araC-family transcriptional regulatory domain protein, partial [Vibrio parahaemolyticus EKP-028]